MSETEPKRGRGRPPKDPADVRKLVAIRLPAEVVDAVMAKADRAALNFTEAMEAAARTWLETDQQDPRS